MLGLVQICLASTGLILLITLGVQPITLVFVVAATSATIASRLLFGKLPDHKLNGGKDSD